MSFLTKAYVVSKLHRTCSGNTGHIFISFKVTFQFLSLLYHVIYFFSSMQTQKPMGLYQSTRVETLGVYSLGGFDKGHLITVDSTDCIFIFCLKLVYFQRPTSYNWILINVDLHRIFSLYHFNKLYFKKIKCGFLETLISYCHMEISFLVYHFVVYKPTVLKCCIDCLRLVWMDWWMFLLVEIWTLYIFIEVREKVFCSATL